MKKSFSNVGWIILATTLLHSCQFKQQDPETVVIGTEKAVTTLDPRQATDFYSMRATRLIYDGLFKLDENMQPILNLAARFTVDKTQTIYDFWLKENLQFHDGTPLTANDVVATYNSIIDPATKSAYRNSFEKISKCEVMAPNQLRLTLKEPFNILLYALVTGIIPEKFTKGPFTPIGSGPYQVDKNLGQDGLRLKRHNNYFAGRPSITKLFFKPVLEDSVRLLDLLKGGIDILQNTIPPVLLKKAEEDPQLTVEKTPGLVYAYLGLNFKDPQLAKLPVRQAIAHAINRDEIIQYKLRGLATPADGLLANNHFMRSNQYLKELPQYDFNPQKAKQLLDSVGLKDPDGDGPLPRLNFTYKTSTNPERLEIAQVIVEQLKKVGIAVELKPLEFGVFFEDIKQGNFQLFSLEWSGVTSEDIFYYAFHSASVPPDGANRGRYSNAKLDALVIEGRREADLDKRQKIYAEV
jgi:peptide/nickel transport system substrate-binding protein